MKMLRMKAYLFLSRLSSFTGRAVAFFFVVSILLLFFYLVGNYQDFLDSTQIFLLSLLHVSLGLQLACGVWLAGFLVYRNRHEHRRFLLRWILLILSFVFCAGLLVALSYVQQWLQS
jgi:hypothetical protein